MEDPVILPGSRVSIDRATIRSHLLSDPHDPFNRAPLKMEDVIPGRSYHKLFDERMCTNCCIDTELKAKIESFKSERLAERRRVLEPMDTTN